MTQHEAGDCSTAKPKTDVRTLTTWKGAASIAIASMVTACGGGGSDDAPPAFAQVCDELVGKTVGAGKIAATTLSAKTATVADTCVASGQIVSSPTSTINFRFELPNPAAWNQKLIHVGGGGFNGRIESVDTNYPQRIRERGYVSIASDSGHTTQDPSSTDASWALNNPSAVENFAFASFPQVLAAGTDAARLVYGTAPTRKYFLGASTGGKEALIQAQRFPQNYDGIISLVPVVDYTIPLQKVLAIYQTAAANNSAGWLNANKVKLYSDAQMQACDALDGLGDGVINNIKACTFDPRTLRCPNGIDAGDACLSDAQLATVHEITTDTILPVTTANGITTNPRYGTGEESFPVFGWPMVFFGSKPDMTDSAGYLFINNWVKYFVTGDLNASPLTHDPAAYASRWRALSAIMSANNPDMNAFADRGGKLIMMGSWSDHLVPVRPTVDLYNRTVDVMGQAKVNSFLRFYTTSGLTHALTATNADVIDYLTALENWVEKGTAPGDLTAAKLDSTGATLFTRPLCRYPALTQYDGTGNPKLAGSFACAGSLR